MEFWTSFPPGFGVLEKVFGFSDPTLASAPQVCRHFSD
jgi:hypothetical protein